MPVSGFTSKLLELEDVIISDLHTTNTEVHGAVLIVAPLQNLFMITDLLFSKIFLLWGKRLSSTTGKDAIIALTAKNVFMNLFLYFLNIAASLPDLLFMPSIY